MTRKSTYLLVSALSLLTLAGCGTQSTKSTGSTRYAAKQELNWTESSELATADLAKATDTLSFTVLQNTQEGLYRLNKSGTPKNALATSTKLTNGGKTYTFKLRKDAKWSNGQP
jgi:ABC-type oligopeptide transport system, periplasmic component